MAEEPRVVVIGAGIGGLTAAAVLARAGLDVSVLEAHIYPGGCAGTFYHQGYRFDAGATLAGGFYPGGPMNLIAGVLGIESWPAKIAQPAMTVHLPDGYKVNRRGDDLRWEEHRSAFGKSSDQFWNWQENTADLLWELALRLPSWPPQNLSQMLSLAKIGLPWLVNSMSGRDFYQLVRDSFSPVAAHLPASNERLKLFVDAQLLISAQTISLEANSLFGAAALDLPRRGVVHLKDGMGTIAQKIVDALLYHGGKIHYRNEVSRIVTEKKRVVAVETKRGDSHPADLVVANLTPWNIASLLNRNEIALRNLPHKPIHEGWGAFMVYVGADGTVTPANYPLHHQVVRRRPLGEGNTVFVSLSPEWDPDRAPSGKRAVTISTHTELKKWWYLFTTDSKAYEEQKQAYTSRILEAAEVALPGIQAAASLILPGTPVTFQRFTRRQMGWVGGFPQTNIFKYVGPRLTRDLWMVGDSIFPGQSTAATALGGLRVAHNILSEL
ncbi:MAG TPA: NAD(P)/FAD-dependent oxidoreductase, partial [Anaerolineales bacterium]|nr:NAD(P)/FAD-dependent oxidoreductase [Anaerolineales bacterium]